MKTLLTAGLVCLITYSYGVTNQQMFAVKDAHAGTDAPVVLDDINCDVVTSPCKKTCCQDYNACINAGVDPSQCTTCSIYCSASCDRTNNPVFNCPTAKGESVDVDVKQEAREALEMLFEEK